MACRKKAYFTRLAANQALAEVANKRDPRHTETATYRCPACNLWHLTSQPQPNGRRR